MTPESPSRFQSVLSQAQRWGRQHAWQAGLVGGGSVAAAAVGYGLVHSLLPLLSGRLALAGAVVGGVVAAVVLPLALWARLPMAPRLTLARAPAAPATPLVVAQPIPQAQAAVSHSRTAQAVHAAALFGRASHAASGDVGVDLPRAASLLPGMPANTGTMPDLDLSLPALVDAQRPVRDALTGAYTQQHFVAAADREWSRIRRHGEDAALLMIDIDRLKGLNERLGQACGDAMLVEVTRQVSTTLRQYDLLARFGGGVLVVYLPHTDPIGALDVAERIRERVAGLRINFDQHSVRSTVSVGVAAIGASHGALDEVIAEAGVALRDAKAAGRNCVRAAPIPPRRSTNQFPLGAQRPLGPL